MVLSILGSAGIKVVNSDREYMGIIEYLDRYIENLESKVSSSSYQAYKSYYKKLKEWLKDEGALKGGLDWLTLRKCEDWYVLLLKSMTPKSANERLNYLSRALDRAVDEELIEVNPAKKVKRVKRGETLDRMAFDLDEANQLISWLIKKKDPLMKEWAYAAMLAMMAGCRLKDAVNMPISALKDGVLTYTSSKSNKELKVPLMISEYADLLAKVKGEFICPGLHQYFEKSGKNRMSSEFTELVILAGIKQSYHKFEKSERVIAQKTFHSLRHTLRTLIVSGGGSDAQADLILGHSPGEGKRYTHSEMDSLKKVLDDALN
ncbi:site-specific integrase [Rubritalea profundi]|uniref:Tyr recombinase domain-containing protein n=1 Tax=Rubritalea profundi TaxID=1658618 RepID=A0A2S7TYW9_9BACT|nr:phage integrase SAM-like domain-containing protein [Rubritalea profundi]PQJ27457.1 hypothetical protein BSZ32_02390 [Rubritalea profundi]